MRGPSRTWRRAGSLAPPAPMATIPEPSPAPTASSRETDYMLGERLPQRKRNHNAYRRIEEQLRGQSRLNTPTQSVRKRPRPEQGGDRNQHRGARTGPSFRSTGFPCGRLVRPACRVEEFLPDGLRGSGKGPSSGPVAPGRTDREHTPTSRRPDRGVRRQCRNVTGKLIEARDEIENASRTLQHPDRSRSTIACMRTSRPIHSPKRWKKRSNSKRARRHARTKRSKGGTCRTVQRRHQYARQHQIRIDKRPAGDPAPCRIAKVR